MRVSLETIREEGERVSTHSKFYIWDDMLFEPSTYRGKPTKSYKPVTDADRIAKALQRHGERERIFQRFHQFSHRLIKLIAKRHLDIRGITYLIFKEFNYGKVVFYG